MQVAATALTVVLGHPFADAAGHVAGGVDVPLGAAAPAVGAASSNEAMAGSVDVDSAGWTQFGHAPVTWTPC